LDDVEVMIADPYKWAQRWLSEFRDDPNDTFMVAIFADHCMRLFGAYTGAIEKTRPR
jgi:hypothetical protein